MDVAHRQNVHAEFMETLCCILLFAYYVTEAYSEKSNIEDG